MPICRPPLGLPLLAALMLPLLAQPLQAQGLTQAQLLAQVQGQPATPSLAAPLPGTPGAGSAADLATSSRGAPSGRSGAATRGLPAPRDAQAPAAGTTLPTAPQTPSR